MHYRDPDVRCPKKAIKLIHSLTPMNSLILILQEHMPAYIPSEVYFRNILKWIFH